MSQRLERLLRQRREALETDRDLLGEAGAGGRRRSGEAGGRLHPPHRGGPGGGGGLDSLLDSSSPSDSEDERMGGGGGTAGGEAASFRRYSLARTPVRSGGGSRRGAEDLLEYYGTEGGLFLRKFQPLSFVSCLNVLLL